ncbi:hypothetical protein AGMMS49975_14610 [Clostridia bacterium]|nr:hypothetical protein AGMMS49975_14610 [Clostridia bacterium]
METKSDKEYREIIGGNIRAARREKGMEIGDLADALGVNENYLELAERGKHEMHIAKLVEAGRILGKSLDWLAGVSSEVSEEIGA